MQILTLSFLLMCFLMYAPLMAGDIQLTQGDGDAYGFISPRFNPEGDKITYACSKSGPYRIWIMDTGGGNQRELTHLSWDMNPVWSNSGNFIAFESYGPDRKRGSFSIWIVDAGSGKAWEFIKAAEKGDQNPCWSPDGKSIVWTHGNQLWIAPFKNPETAIPLTKTAVKAYEYCGDWSSDGKWIAYMAADAYDTYGIPFKIWIIRPDGTGQKKIFNGIPAYQVKWSKNNRFLYFSTETSIIRLNMESGVQEKLFDWKASSNGFDISPDERWFIYADQGDDWEGNIFKKQLFPVK